MPDAFGDADNSVTNTPTTIDERGAGHFLPALLDADRSIPDFIACAIGVRRAGIRPTIVVASDGDSPNRDQTPIR